MSNSKKPVNEKSIANVIIDLIINECELVHNQLKDPYAIVFQNSIRHVYNIKSKSFTDWVASKYYASRKSALSDATLKTIISTLSGKAVFEGRQVSVHTRIAKTAAGYWLDLCNDNWEAVLINQDGWEVLSGDSVPLFYRSNSMQSIPNPIAGGSIDSLWKLVNITSQDLLDRAIHIELPAVDNRLQSTVVDQVFESQYARIVGALMDQFVTALRLIDKVQIAQADKPRMLDFAILGEAVSTANGLPEGAFCDYYKTMRRKGVYLAGKINGLRVVDA